LISRFIPTVSASGLVIHQLGEPDRKLMLDGRPALEDLCSASSRLAASICSHHPAIIVISTS
jgi:hypothetical protein